ncbi:MAG: hypothetical protein CMO80_11685 [Verrucomicrobiales bacterium]|nr:hypothetical protein [Verrucomicrobiales bacterium]|tara:strand:+ start:195 stop:1013 length:819 start_codon:yes stop_codon:yes gene_type:complete
MGQISGSARIFHGMNSSGAVSGADYLPMFLLFILLAVLVIAGLLVWLAAVHVRSHRRENERQHRLLPDDEFHDPGLHFAAVAELPQRWVAVQGVKPEALVNAFQMEDLAECSWTEGMNVMEEQRLFVSPPIDDWILIFGESLPDPAEDIDRTYRFLNKLSIELGHTQFFSVNRALGYHAWAKLYQGATVRAYAWAGETLWNQGNPTSAELSLKMRCPDYFEHEEISWQEQHQFSHENIERVPSLASRWSIDPTSIDPKRMTPYPGFSGNWRA